MVLTGHARLILKDTSSVVLGGAEILVKDFIIIFYVMKRIPSQKLYLLNQINRERNVLCTSNSSVTHSPHAMGPLAASSAIMLASVET